MGLEGETWQHWEVPDRRVDTEEHYAKSERAHHLKRAIPQLRPALRTIVELQQVHDIPIKKIAEIAGISVAATKSRLSVLEPAAPFTRVRCCGPGFAFVSTRFFHLALYGIQSLVRNEFVT